MIHANRVYHHTLGTEPRNRIKPFLQPPAGAEVMCGIQDRIPVAGGWVSRFTRWLNSLLPSFDECRDSCDDLDFGEGLLDIEKH